MSYTQYMSMTMKQIKNTVAYAQAASGKSKLDKAGLCDLLSRQWCTMKQIKQTSAYAQAPEGKSSLNKADLCALLSDKSFEWFSSSARVLDEDKRKALDLYRWLDELPLPMVSFINFPAGLGSEQVMGARYKPTGKTLAWRRIEGQEGKIGEWTIKTRQGPKNTSIFVKGYHDLQAMAVSIQSGEVSESDFSELVCFLLAKARSTGKKLVNENQHIRLLHFKFV